MPNNLQWQHHQNQNKNKAGKYKATQAGVGVLEVQTIGFMSQQLTRLGNGQQVSHFGSLDQAKQVAAELLNGE